MSRLPWLIYDHLEIYDCWSCPFACHIWSDGRKWCCSSMFACHRFESRLPPISFDLTETIGEQLTLF